MAKYNIHSVKVNIDDGILNDVLKKRLIDQTWEKDEANSVAMLDKNASVLELGACIGIVSTLINKRISNPTNHVAIETNIKLIETLNKVKQDNACGFHIVNAFLSMYPNDIKDFSIHPNHIMAGRLGKAKGFEHIKCKGITLQELEKKFNLQFDTIVMDIEQGEYELYHNGFFAEENIQNIKSMMIEFHNNKDKDTVRTHIMKQFNEKIIKVHGNNNGVYFYNRKL